MTPVRSLLPLAKGLLRLSVFIFALMFYFDRFKEFDVTHTSWLLAVFYLVFSLMLFIGSFTSSAAVSIISGFVIFALSVFEMYRHWHGMDTTILLFLFSASIGLYFIARGNKG